MALFYLIAKKKVCSFEWGNVYSRIDTFRDECITVFPISERIGLPNNALGITASAKFHDQMDAVIKEVKKLLEALWQLDFEVYDLYKGKAITKLTFSEVMDYL
jgi:hypothetical protein